MNLKELKITTFYEEFLNTESLLGRNLKLREFIVDNKFYLKVSTDSLYKRFYEIKEDMMNEMY